MAEGRSFPPTQCPQEEQCGRFKFPSNTPAGGTLDVLIATQEFADLPGALAPDIIIPPRLTPINGKVCFKNDPDNTVLTINDCLSYGAFTGDTEGAGASAGQPTIAVSTVTEGVTVAIVLHINSLRAAVLTWEAL